MKLLALFLLTLILFVSACTAAANKPTEPTNQEGSSAASLDAQANLANTRWVLESFSAPGTETSVIVGSTITLEFGADGQVGGSGGCNSYSGTYQTQGTTLSFSQLVSTLMACADEQVTRQEQQYLEALQSAGEFELTSGQLTIRFDNGQKVLHFRPA